LVCFFKQDEILASFSSSGLGVAKLLVVGVFFFFFWVAYFVSRKGGRNFEGFVLIFDRMKGKFFWVCCVLDFHVKTFKWIIFSYFPSLPAPRERETTYIILSPQIP
jgi:hypothetical protein